MNIDRREFASLLARSLSALALGTAATRHYGVPDAATRPANDYRALVCIFLLGGNDGNNMIIPVDTARNIAYAKMRGRLALTSGLLELKPTSCGESYAMHPRMARLADLYNRNQVAAVFNVGPLLRPTTREQYINRNVAVPANLFSHADQQSQVQTLCASGEHRSGWAARLADSVSSFNHANCPALVSLHGAPVLCHGSTTSSALLPRVKIAKSCHSNQLAAQLERVADLISAREQTGVQRQIFFCAFGGFDHHANQLDAHGTLLGMLDAAMSAFYWSTVDLGIKNNVTTFMMSEFGRTMAMNPRLGSDHGWGNHLLVMGGAVRGGNAHGVYPTLEAGGPDDCDTHGRWIPTTSLDQFGATLAHWFGVDDTELDHVFPNFQQFRTRDLGFMA